MVGCVGNAPTLVRLDIRFTGGSRSLRGYQPKVGDQRRGLPRVRGAPAPLTTKKEQTPLPTWNLSSHPQECFTAVLSVFQAHLPVHDLIGSCEASGLEKSGRGIRQYRSAS